MDPLDLSAILSLDGTDPEKGVGTTVEGGVEITDPEERERLVNMKDAEILAGGAVMSQLGATAPADPTPQAYIPETYGKYRTDKHILPSQAWNIEERRGEAQTTGNKWVNGILKADGKILTMTIGGLTGTAVGILDTIKTGEASAFWNNEIFRATDKLNEELDYNLPNFYTKAERERRWWNSMGTANFWADQVANGMSFLASAALTEIGATAIGGGVGAVGNAVGLVGRAARLFKHVNRASFLGKTARTARFISRTGKLQDSARLIRQLGTGAGFEAALETRHSYDEVKTDLVNELLADRLDAETLKNGGKPLTIEDKGKLLTPQQRQEVENQATSVANGVFVGNMVLVGMSNMIMLPQLYGLGSSLKRARIPRVAPTMLDNAAGRLGIGAKGADALRVAGKVGGTGLYEGFVEEGLQSSMGNAAHNYAILSGLRENGDMVDMLGNITDSMLKGMGDTYGSDEGMKEVLIGTLIGITGLPTSIKNSTIGRAIGEVKDRRSMVDRLVELSKSNPDLFNVLKQNGYSFANILKRGDALESAYKQGDMALIKDLERDNLFDYVMTKVMTGQYEDIAEEIAEIEAMSSEQFREMGGYTEKDLPEHLVNERKIDVTQALKTRAENIRKGAEMVDEAIKFSPEDRVLGIANPKSPGYVRMQLIHAVAVMDDSDQREKAMIEEVARMTGGQVNIGKQDEAKMPVITYLDAEGKQRKVDIGSFNKPAPIASAIQETQFAIDILEKKAQKSDSDKETLAELKKLLEFEKEQLNTKGPEADLSPEEYLEVFKPAKELNTWKINSPAEAAKHEEKVIELLEDLRKVRATRQSAIMNYRLLLNPETRQDAVQEIAKQIQEINDATDPDKKVKEEDLPSEPETRRMQKFRAKILTLRRSTDEKLKDLDESLKEVELEGQELLRDIAALEAELNSGKPLRVAGKFATIETFKKHINKSRKALLKAEQRLADLAEDRMHAIQMLNELKELEENPINPKLLGRSLRAAFSVATEGLDIDEDMSFEADDAQDISKLLQDVAAMYSQQHKEISAVENALTERVSQLQSKIEVFEGILRNRTKTNADGQVQLDLEGEEAWLREEIEFTKEEIQVAKEALDKASQEAAVTRMYARHAADLAETYLKLATYKQILKAEEAKDVSKKESKKKTDDGTGNDFEVNEETRTEDEDGQRTILHLRKPDISMPGYGKTSGRFSWPPSGWIGETNKTGAKEDYKKYKARIDKGETLEGTDLKAWKIAESQMRWNLFANENNITPFSGVLVHKNNIPKELENDLTEDMFYDDEDIKFVAFIYNKPHYDGGKSLGKTSQFVRLEKGQYKTKGGKFNTRGDIVFTSIMLPGKKKETEGDSGYRRFTNKWKGEEFEDERTAEWAGFRADILGSNDQYIYNVFGKQNGSIVKDENLGENLGRVAKTATDYKRTPLMVAESPSTMSDKKKETDVEEKDGIIRTLVDFGVGLTNHRLPSGMSLPGLVWAFDQVRMIRIPMYRRVLDEDEVNNVMRIMNKLLNVRQEVYDGQTVKNGGDAWEAAKAYTVSADKTQAVPLYNMLLDVVHISKVDGKSAKYKLEYGKKNDKWGFIFGPNKNFVGFEEFKANDKVALNALREFLGTKYHQVNARRVKDATTRQSFQTKPQGKQKAKTITQAAWKATEGEQWTYVSLDENLNVVDAESETFENYNEYLLKDRGLGGGKKQSPLLSNIKRMTNDEVLDAQRIEGVYWMFGQPGKTPSTKGANYLANVKGDKKKSSAAGTRPDVTPSGAPMNDLSDYYNKGDEVTDVEFEDVTEEFENATEIGDVTDITGEPSAKPEVKTDEPGVYYKDGKKFVKRDVTVNPADLADMLKQAEGKKGTKTDNKDDDVQMFMRDTEELGDDYITETYGVQKERVKKMRQKLNIERVTGLIEGMGDVGVARLEGFGHILVSNLAPGGALYHEAFHDVSLYILSNQDSAKLYNLVRRIPGKTTTFKNASKKMSELTDEEAEEWLAEEFRRYVLYKGEYQLGQDTVEDDRNALVKFFEAIRDTMRTFFNLDKGFEYDPDMKDINDLFKSVVEGQFSKAKRDANKVVTWKPMLEAGMAVRGQSMTFTQDLLSTMTAYLAGNIDFEALIQSSETTAMTPLLEEGYRKGLGSMMAQYRNVLENYDMTKKDRKAMEKAAFLIFPELKVKMDMDKMDDSSSLQGKMRSANVRGMEFRRNMLDLHRSYLKQLGFSKEVIDEVEESDIVTKNYPDSASAMEISPTDSAGKMIKILLGTLPNVEELNSTGLHGVYPLADTIKTLQNELQGTLDYSVQIEKLEALVDEYPWVKGVLDRLPEYMVTGMEDVPTILLKTKFRAHFSQPKIDTLMSFVDDNGRVYSIDPNNERILRTIRGEWTRNQRIKSLQKDSFMVVDEAGTMKYNTKERFPFEGGEKSLSELNALVKGRAELDNLLDVFEHIGIVFSNREKVLDSASNLLDGQTFEEIIRSAALFMMDDIVTGKVALASPFDRSASPSVTRANQLATIEMLTGKRQPEFQHQGPDGKVLYGITQHTYLSMLSHTPFKDVKRYYEMQNNPYAANSLVVNEWALEEETEVWEDEMGFEHTIPKRTAEDRFSIMNMLGMSVSGPGHTGAKISKLTMADVSAGHIAAIMKGAAIALRSADQATEFAVKMNIEHPLKIEEIQEIMQGYLSDEIAAANVSRRDGQMLKNLNTEGKDKKQPKGLRIFKKLLENVDAKTANKIEALIDSQKVYTENTKQSRRYLEAEIEKNWDSLWPSISDTLRDNMQENIDFFAENKIIGDASENGSRAIYGLSRDHKAFKTDTGLSNGTVTAEQLNNFVEEFTVRQFIGKTEFFKVFLGDPGMYSDLFKRTKGGTGTKRTFDVDPQLNRWFEIDAQSRKSFDPKHIPIRTDGRMDFAVLEEPTVISKYFKKYSRSKDIPKEVADAYGEAIERADGTIGVTLEGYRQMSIRGVEWSEIQEDVYNSIMDPRLDTPPPSVLLGTFPPKKFQEFGPQVWPEGTIQPMGYLKMSVIPVHPKLSMINGVESPDMNALYENLQRNELGGFILPSAFKVGAPGKGYHTKITNDLGRIVPIEVDHTDKVTFDLMFWGSQLDVSSKFKGKAPLGTQARVHTLSDLFENGIIREENKHLNEYVKEYNNLLNGMTKVAFNDMLEEFNMEKDAEGNYVVKDNNYKNLLKAMREEATRRDIPRAMLDGLEFMEENNEKNGSVPLFDLMVNKTRMEGLLWSMAGKRVIRQKMRGDMYVQMTNFGLDVRRLSLRDMGEYDLEDTLGFYETEKGEWAMEVYLPHHFKEVLDENVVVKKDGVYVNGEKAGGSDLLKMIGIRIPTDGTHSIDVIKVKGFLPHAAGPTVVVPAELVTKAGSDFDIDKLVMYFPTYRHSAKTLPSGKIKHSIEKLKFYEKLEPWYNAEKKYAEDTLEALREYFLLDDRGWNGPNSVETLVNLLDSNFFGTDLIKDAYKEAEFAEDTEQSPYALMNFFKENAEKAEEIYQKLIKRHAATAGTFEEWKDKNPNETIYTVNSAGASQNKMMDNMIHLLSDETRRGTFLEPVSTNAIDKLAKRLDTKELDLPDLENVSDYHSETTFPHLMRVTDAFLKGAQTVGIDALHNTHHVKAQIAGLRLNLKGKMLKSPNNRAINYAMHFQGFQGMEDSISLGRVRSIDDSNSISGLTGQMVNAAVDVVNKPRLHILNAGPDLAPTWMFLLRAGVPIDSIGMFMNQPIVREYMKAKTSGNSRILRALNKTQSAGSIEASLLSKYTPKGKVVKQEYHFTTSELDKMVGKKFVELTDVEVYKQRQILDDLFIYMEAGQKLGDLVAVQSFDTKIPKSRAHLELMLRSYERTMNMELFQNAEKITNDTTFMKELSSYSMNMNNMFSDMYATNKAGENYQAGYEKFLNVFSDPLKWYLSIDERAKLLNRYQDGYISFLMQNMPQPDGFELKYEQEQLLFGNKSLPARVAAIQKDGDHPLSRNLFLNSLVPVLSPVRSGKDVSNDYLEPVSRTMNSYESNILFDAFKEIEAFDLANNSEFAKDIIKTAFLQAGLSQTPQSFLELIPGSSFMSIGQEVLERYIKNPGRLEQLSGAYFDQFFMNNSHDRRVVPIHNKRNSKIYPYTYEETKASKTARGQAYEKGYMMPAPVTVLYKNEIFSENETAVADPAAVRSVKIRKVKLGSPTFQNYSGVIKIYSNAADPAGAIETHKNAKNPLCP